MKKIFLISSLFLCLPLWARALDPIESGTLIQAQGSSAIYYLAENSKRYVFPNEKTYKTWYADFSQVQEVALEQLQTYPIGGNATYRPGTRLVKITTDPKVYAVEPGGVLRHLADEATASGLYGADWAALVDDVPDAFFVNYQVAADRPVNNLAHPEGTLISYGSAGPAYLVAREGAATVKRLISSLIDNNHRQEFVIKISETIAYPTGTPVTGREDGLTNLLSTNLAPIGQSTAPVLAPNSIFVDSRATVTGTGSLEKPFQTIAEGIAKLQAGQTMYLRGSQDAGGVVYAADVNLNSSGALNNNKIITVYPGEKVMLSGAWQVSGDRWELQELVFDRQGKENNALEISGDFVTLTSLEARDGLSDGVAVLETANQTWINKAKIHGFDDCIYVQPGATNLTVVASQIQNCRSDGVEVFAGSGVNTANLAKTITLINNDITGSASSQTGVNIRGVIGGIVSLNKIHGFSNGQAVVVSNLADSVTVSDNDIFNNSRGIEVKTSAGTPNKIDIFNNLIHDLTDYALRFDGVNGGLRVIHNTLANITGSAFKVQSLGVSSGQIRNNLISGAGANQIDPGSQKALVSNNGWFDGAQAGALSGEDNMVGADVKFVDLFNGDYRLQADSPAVNAGIPLGYVASDLLGRTREVGLPDLGAFELQ